MKIKVRLLGTLPNSVASYDHENGIELEIDEGTNYRDLIKKINLPVDVIYSFAATGRFKQPDDLIIPGEDVNIFRPIGGG